MRPSSSSFWGGSRGYKKAWSVLGKDTLGGGEAMPVALPGLGMTPPIR